MSKDLSPPSVYILPRGEKRRRALVAYEAAMKKAGLPLKTVVNPRLDALGREVLDPKPLTVPMFLEPLGERIARLTRLGQARIDALQYDEEVEFDDDGNQIGDDDEGMFDRADFSNRVITKHEVEGGDFDHLPSSGRKKPAQAPKIVSAATLPEGALEASQSTEKTPPVPADKPA